MIIESERARVKSWLEQLIGKPLDYITGRNTAVIESIDWEDDGKLTVSRGPSSISIRYERIEAVIARLLKGVPIHVDTVLRSGSNDRSVIETILANLPPVGFMKPEQGRNNSRNKVIQWLSQDIHALGKIKDISDESYNEFALNSFTHNGSENLSKPFLLLAGISGTGKTRFVREQAKVSGSLSSTYCLTSVRPDWHEPSDLLGYVSRLNGPAHYITTDVLQFIAKAWRSILDAGLIVDTEGDDTQGKRLVVIGERTTLDAVSPYWLCLDEMNLAPVEQYFADYLSVLETREWHWNGDDFTYACDPLLKASTIEQITNKDELRLQLGFADEKYNDDWKLFCEYGLGIPLNLIVAGTVNMDETTHGFSRKVIDRALTFDFGEFFPNDFNQFFEPDTQNKTLTYPLLSQARIENLAGTADADGKKSIAFLTKVNTILDDTPFKLAFRALNELLIAVISQNPQDELTLKAVWDDFLMCKVFPRIEGDSDKLGDSPSLLEKLSNVLEEELSEIWGGDEPEPLRPDLYREYKADGDKEILITCRSKDKLAWMQSRLGTAGFTSFWP